MSDDEQKIRQLVATWMEASKAGDVEKVLSLMTDDVVFLVTGRAPMRKTDFAAAARSQADAAALKFDGSSDIQEVKILGEWAFMWQKLIIMATPSGGAPVTRSGHTMSIFRKQNGQWLLTRDANMLAPVTS